jgi:hypothetical protein
MEKVMSALRESLDAMQDRNSSRRGVLKSVGAGVAITGLSGVVTASETHSERVRRDELPFPNANYVDIGDDVRDAVGSHWPLLRMSRDRIDELLRKSSVDADTAATLGDRITTLRDTYAVEKSEVTETRYGRKHTYHLVDDRVEALTDEEEAATAEAANAVTEGFRAEGDDDDVTTNWFGKGHKIIAKTAFDYDSVDIYAYEEDDLKNASPDPDSFGCKRCSTDWVPLPIPDVVRDLLSAGVRGLGDESEAKHPPFHFFTTNLDFDIGPYSYDIVEFGGAPGEASYLVSQANDAYYEERAKKLGWAAHYLQDMSVPLHTGAVYDQINPYVKWDGSVGINPRRDLHKAYERFINNNMTNASSPVDYAFDVDLIYSDSLNTSNIAADCKQLADVSSTYSVGILDGLMQGNKDDPDTWNDYGTDVFEVTHNCFDAAGRHMRTFLEREYDR